MANPEHRAKLTEGVEAWNHWRKVNPAVKPDLREASLGMMKCLSLSGADLSETDLYMADLSHANLSKANLRRADLRRAYSYTAGADLSEADLSSANLREAKLSGSNFREANLRCANLSEADLSKADLTRANLSEASLHKADLSESVLTEANLISMTDSAGVFRQADLSEATLLGADLRRANLSGANLYKAVLTQANFSGANLSGAILYGALLIGTNLEGADLTSCSVFGISVWGVNLKGAIQSNLVITPHREEPKIQVDNLEVAQFIYLLLNNERIRHVIDTITSKVVLILGRFTPERKAVLDAIRDQLREKDYLPVLFDFEKPASKDLTGTVSTLANMARFIIADLTDPSSVPHELATIIPGTVVPVQVIVLKGQREYAMFVDLKRRYHWVLEPYRYPTKQTLLAELDQMVIAPAEAKAKELTRK